MSTKKILILTAGFGEGHNTAAYNISEALKEKPDVEVSIVDIYQQTLPGTTKFLQACYRFAINKLPMAWGIIFNFLDRPGGLEKSLFMAARLRRSLAKKVSEFQPDVIVSTYPLYAFLIAQLRESCHAACYVPLVTVITDSTAINTSWYRAKSDFFIVADEETALVLRKDNIPSERVHVLGFPVAPRLATMTPLPETAGAPWKILYLPSSKTIQAFAVIRALAELPDVQVTVITGRMRELHAFLGKSGVIDGKRVQLIGWTNQIPELLSTHHLYVGKAGGAIVHEAMAAQCPILISQIVPGQEEGNIELIERHDIGRLAAHYPATLAASAAEVFAGDAATWRRWKQHLKTISYPAASQDIAEFVLGIFEGEINKEVESIKRLRG
ncbi:MAG: hypothetical protein ACH346_05100 [Chthoniobacterales bacterium]